MDDTAGLSLSPPDIHEQLARAAGLEAQVFYVDVPWRFRANRTNLPPGDLRAGRNAAAHYRVMTLKDIAALPVGDMAAKQAVMFFWITGPFLAVGAHLPIFKAWGFKAKAIGFTWIKLKKSAPGLFLDAKLDLHMGLGLTTRKNSEVCLIATRGKSLRQSRNIHEVGLFPRREHSRKPDEFRERVEQYVGPGLVMAELFARTERPGWHAYGDELGKF